MNRLGLIRTGKPHFVATGDGVLVRYEDERDCFEMMGRARNAAYAKWGSLARFTSSWIPVGEHGGDVLRQYGYACVRRTDK